MSCSQEPLIVFEFEEGFNLACLPQDMEVKFPFGVVAKFCYEFPYFQIHFSYKMVVVKFCYEFPTFKFISPTKWYQLINRHLKQEPHNILSSCHGVLVSFFQHKIDQRTNNQLF